VSVHERIVYTLAWIAVAAFVAGTLITFSGIYGWLHPALWGLQGLCFLVVEGAFYYLRGPRSDLDGSVVLALWASLGVWVSVEHFAVVLSAIILLRALPEGVFFRVFAVVAAAAIASLASFADINPWSGEPGPSWLRSLFFVSCLLNGVLLLARASLPAKENR
jgi:hypothetical protein